MIPRPILRTKTFWLGLFILAFIGWGWARSFRTLDVVNLDALHSSILISNSVNGLSLIQEYDNAGHWDDFKSVASQMPPPANAPRPLFPTPSKLVFFNAYKGGSGFALIAAHWFLIALFLIPWSAFFVWRHRRVKEFLAATH